MVKGGGRRSGKPNFFCEEAFRKILYGGNV